MDESISPEMAVLTMWDLCTIYVSRNQNGVSVCVGGKQKQMDCKHMHTFCEKRESLVELLVIFKRSSLRR